MGTDQQSNSAGGHQSDSEFIDELTQIFRAEQALLKALPFLQKVLFQRNLPLHLTYMQLRQGNIFLN